MFNLKFCSVQLSVCIAEIYRSELMTHEWLILGEEFWPSHEYQAYAEHRSIASAEPHQHWLKHTEDSEKLYKLKLTCVTVSAKHKHPTVCFIRGFFIIS